MNKLKELSSHFSFGKNWSSYARLVQESHVQKAEEGLRSLLAQDTLEGKTFLDIGCGSGLHSLSALRLGAQKVVAMDLDPQSVQTTKALLSQRAPQKDWILEEKSIFEFSPQAFGLFDIVYSWGVLHHTGAMKEALHQASLLVEPGGIFIFALYRRIFLDFFWKWEKRWYTNTSEENQEKAHKFYSSLFRLGLFLQGRSFHAYKKTYLENRGMNFEHDVHDWLGGYPYESISPSEVKNFMIPRGFKLIHQVTRPYGLGLLGSGCNEYVYQRL